MAILNNGYLYLDFYDRLRQVKTAGNSNELYTTSLTEQYASIRARLGPDTPDTLQAFVNYLVDQYMAQTFALSLPRLERKFTYDEQDRRIRNVVVRPFRTRSAAAVLPEGYDVILIGDIFFGGSLAKITVKGIELIDSSTRKSGEMEITCVARCAFGCFTGPSGAELADFGPDKKPSVLTNNLIDELCAYYYPVSEKNEENVKHYLRELDDYLAFRRYYLGRQSEKYEKVDNVVTCDSYMLPRSAYMNDRDELEGHLLDGLKDFGKGDQVILDGSLSDATPYPLIRVDIGRNRKELFEKADGRGRPEYETWLNRYSKDSVSLSPSPVEYDEKCNLKGKINYYTYTPGERYLFAHEDVEPDCSDIDAETEESFKTARSGIELRYDGIIRTETEEYSREAEKSVAEKYAAQAEEYEKSLADSLEADVLENRDADVKKEYAAKVREAAEKLNKETKARIETVNKEIKKLASGGKKKSKTGGNTQDDGSEGREKRLASLNDELAELKAREKANEEAAGESVGLRSLYEERNARLVSKKRAELKSAELKETERLAAVRREELEKRYEPDIKAETEARRRELEKERDDRKKERIENDTVRVYHIYYSPRNGFDLEGTVRDVDERNLRYLTYDNRAEKTKLERQERALDALKRGNVRNPYIASYLFEPESLGTTGDPEGEDPEWFLPGLNESQKKAVRKALASESLFLLQGPPGTGKTQVIAEICAQLTKGGKKVLISSETHKAIDNVFERLPKVPEIRPLRLIPSTNEKKDTEYSPEKLVDNFYANIVGNLEKRIERFDNFEQWKEKFKSEMDGLRLEYAKLRKLDENHSRYENEKKRIISETEKNRSDMQKLQESANDLTKSADILRRTKRSLERCDFSESEDVDGRYVKKYEDALRDILRSSRYVVLGGARVENAGMIRRADPDAVRSEIAEIKKSSDGVSRERRLDDVKRRMDALRDPFTYDEPPKGSAGYEEYLRLRGEYIALRSEENGSRVDFSELAPTITSIFPDVAGLDLERLDYLPDEIIRFRAEQSGAERTVRDEIDSEVDSIEEREAEAEKGMKALREKNRELESRIKELDENDTETEYRGLDEKLRGEINLFFKNFEVEGEYEKGDYGRAFDIIDEKWKNLERDHAAKKAENDRRMPIYRHICEYLRESDVVEDGRGEYTKRLCDCVNVYGITCTSRDRYTKGSNDGLGKYGIEEVDIRNSGIDVVIVDEVSKSFFLDLVIPILYGKTVILVGDHRQLPPMYDLRHLGAEEIEELGEDHITKERNEEYTELYETCVFKELFERAPDDYKIMLDRQYRCHSDIMKVFNHFYGGAGKGLKVGKKNQDDEKAHNLTVDIGGKTVIDPEHHVYFVNCDKKETSLYDGSTSKINEQEAEVAVKLLNCLDEASKRLIKAKKIRSSDDEREDERPSVGVICTYGDQASLINRRRARYYNGFSHKHDERFIVSTVDDFQGDERDIIIVSMVRNTDNRHANLDFIKKFERINVALSRARKLLIILGSEKFLTDERCVIELPDLETKEVKRCYIFREILDTVKVRGRVFNAGDILEEEK